MWISLSFGETFACLFRSDPRVQFGQPQARAKEVGNPRRGRRPEEGLKGKDRVGHERKRGVGNSEGSMKDAECNSPENPSNNQSNKKEKQSRQNASTPPRTPYIFD